MSGKDEAKFFEIVTQMATMSAKNRNLQLPETAEAGRKVGEMIKSMAKKDTRPAAVCRGRCSGPQGWNAAASDGDVVVRRMKACGRLESGPG